jgi:hypothetical protein
VLTSDELVDVDPLVTELVAEAVELLVTEVEVVTTVDVLVIVVGV